MPDTALNKQTLINLLIDSPLREPIKINLIDIVNNTQEPDLPKVYPTITKELEIFQKATERRMKLAEETIGKLSGTAPAPTDKPTQEATPNQPPQGTPMSANNAAVPTPPTPPVAPTTPPPAPNASTDAKPPLSVPPLDLPPLPASPSTSQGEPAKPNASQGDNPPAPPTPPTPPSNEAQPSQEDTNEASQAPQQPASEPTKEPEKAQTPEDSADEAALAEIQKELDALKTDAATDAKPQE